MTKYKSSQTISSEDAASPPFALKIPVSFERGDGVYAWDEDGKKYLDFTAGWGVTSLGHASPVVTGALAEQGGKIIQNPNSGASYSPARARLLELMQEILPHNLSRIFFSSTGAEANDAAIKLARKATGRMNVISTVKSFHGRTISTASATGQASHRERYAPLMPGYLFVPFNDIGAVEKVMDSDTAAVIVEPIQGEGGIQLPGKGYLEGLSRLCVERGVHLILDEIQTGFFRTGKLFATSGLDLKAGFMTMAKGIAGGFPFGAFAMTEEISSQLERGDHGGTYAGNPLGCAVAYAVIRHMLDRKIGDNVLKAGERTMTRLKSMQKNSPGVISEVRGRGLLIAVQCADDSAAGRIVDQCRDAGLILNITQGRVIRMFPALNISLSEIDEGMDILEEVINKA